MIYGNLTQSLTKTASSSSINTDCKANDPHLRTQSTLDASSENIGSSVNYGKKCRICEKNFMFRKRNLCKICNDFVCSEHFSKVRDGENVCDFCDRKESKRLVKQEIEKEIQVLAFELDKIKEVSNKIHREYCQKISEVNALEQELGRVKDLADSRRGMMLARISNERYRTSQNAEMMEQNKRIIEEAAISEKEISVKYDAVQAQLMQTSNELLNLKARKLELSAELVRKLKSDAKTRSLVMSKLCEACQDKLTD